MAAAREGVFLASVGDHAIALNGDANLTTFIAQYRLEEQLTGDGAQDVQAEQMSITGYHYMEKKDGSLNDFTIRKLKETFGWDGRDPSWLEESLPANARAKVTIEFETYEGKTRPKVKFIDHPNSTGNGVTHATAEEKAQIRNKIGAKLRAIAGGSPAAKPPMPQSKPTMPARTPTQPVPGCTQEEAWRAFSNGIVIPEGAAPEAITALQSAVEQQWTKILIDMFPDKSDPDLTPQDWLRVRNEAPSKYVPF